MRITSQAATRGHREWTVDTGDCTRLMHDIEPGSIDAVVTDPPYGIRYHRPGKSIANDRAPYVWWLDLASRALKRSAPLLCFCRWDVAHPWRSAIEWAGFRIRSCAVWDREVHSQGDTRRAFAPSHELCWLATKGAWTLPGKRPRDVFRVRRVWHKRALHPTQKPDELMRSLVVSVTRPGDLVLDPFCGSGSTGEACVRTGRRFWGMEIDAGHAATAEARLRSVSAEIARSN